MPTSPDMEHEYAWVTYLTARREFLRKFAGRKSIDSQLANIEVLLTKHRARIDELQKKLAKPGPAV